MSVGVAKARRNTGAYQRAVRWLKAHPDTPCTWCGAPATTIDHEPPIALGGTDADLYPACAPCNYKRGALLKAALAKERKRRQAVRFDSQGALVANATVANEANDDAERARVSCGVTHSTPPAHSIPTQTLASHSRHVPPSQDW